MCLQRMHLTARSVPVAVEMLGYIYGINKYPSSLRGEVISDYKSEKCWTVMASMYTSIYTLVHFRLGLHT